jgi:hypothetical protein
MGLTICRHIKLDGARCGSPALCGQHYCYFHAGAHRTIPSVNLWRNPKRQALEIQYRNDPLSLGLANQALDIQLGYTRVVQGLWLGLLNVRQARLFLNELHEAAGLRDCIATGDSAVTSNRQRPPIPGGCRAATSESPGD